MVAWPADYGHSGVMTLAVSHQGKVLRDRSRRGHRQARPRDHRLRPRSGLGRGRRRGIAAPTGEPSRAPKGDRRRRAALLSTRIVAIQAGTSLGVEVPPLGRRGLEPPAGRIDDHGPTSETPPRQIGRGAAAVRLRRRAAGRAVRQGERSRCRGDAAGRLGRRAFATSIRHPGTGAASPSTASAAFSIASRAPSSCCRPRSAACSRRRANPAQFDTGFWSGGLQFDHVFDYSYDGIMRAYEDCLQRLGMNRIDLLIIHDLDFWHHADRAEGAGLSGSADRRRLARARGAAQRRARSGRSAPGSTSSA